MIRRFVLAVALTSLAPSPGAGATTSANGLVAESGGTAVRVDALTDSILRVRVARDGKWPEDASWAVAAAVRRLSATVRASNDGFSTSAVAVQLERSTLRLTVKDPGGRIIIADDAGPAQFDGARFTLRKTLPLGERIYGLGDKTGNFDRRGKSFVDWNTDAWGLQRDADASYMSIPVYIASRPEGGAYGLFLDNTWRSCFDFGHRDAGTIEVGSGGGPIDY